MAALRSKETLLRVGLKGLRGVRANIPTRSAGITPVRSTTRMTGAMRVSMMAGKVLPGATEKSHGRDHCSRSSKACFIVLILSSMIHQNFYFYAKILIIFSIFRIKINIKKKEGQGIVIN